MARILINNCGSQAVDIIKLLKEDKNNYIVYLTYKNEDKYKDVADLVLSDFMYNSIDDYVNWLLDMCKVYQIDVFIPFNSMSMLVDFKELFENISVTMLVSSNTEVFTCLNEKIKTYQFLGSEFKQYIPLYYEANTVREFKSACEKIRGLGKDVCIKYSMDIASNSFRIINFGLRDISELDVKGLDVTKRLSKMIDYETLIDMFVRAYGVDNFEKPLMVMEYMSGVEISCDCLKNNNLDIVIIRKKVRGDVQHVVHDKTIRDACEKILDKTGYDGPCNIQFMYTLDNNLKLLEVNTRMSGGIMLSSYATGINLPLLAVNSVLGQDLFDVKCDYEDTKIISDKAWKFEKL